MNLIARNASISTLGGYTQDRLQKLLEARPFAEISGLGKESRGFVPPVDGDASLLHMAGNVGAFALRIDTKLLPASVVAAEVTHRAEEIEEVQGFRLGRKQRKELTEQITDELLPKAFTRTTLIRGWADWDAGLLVVDAANAGKRDTVFDLLFDAVLKLSDINDTRTEPMRPWQSIEDPASAMTDWLATSEAPPGITVDNGALIEGDEGAKVRMRPSDKPEMTRMAQRLGRAGIARIIELTLDTNLAVIGGTRRPDDALEAYVAELSALMQGGLPQAGVGQGPGQPGAQAGQQNPQGRP